MKKMEIQIKHFQNKKKQEMKKVSVIYTQLINKNIKHHVFNNNTKVNTNLQHITNTKIKELDDFNKSSDYEAMWEIAIDKWTRNWNFYRERLTDSILKKFGMNNKRQKRQTK